MDAKPAKRCRKMTVFMTIAILMKKHEKLIPQYILYTGFPEALGTGVQSANNRDKHKAHLSRAIRDT